MRTRASASFLLTALAAATVVMTVAFLAGNSRTDIAVGWCCLEAQGACGRGYDALLCRDSGGIAYSTDGSVCSQACSLSVAHAGPATN